ncbi:MAG: peptide MFS transporter [Novosphingobium sp.]|nr:peptide MFS transporter [Novosphingobium sp.]
MASTIPESGDAQGTLMGHPKGLFVLFFAEMWERFSYYGMRALLIFYLTKHWLFSDEDAGIIYGAYTALVYITPVVGGYLADRYLGQRKAVLFGAVLLTLGHFFMAFEGEPAAGHEGNSVIYVFWLALALIIVGSGFLKANISVIVGQLYPRTDVRRDGAYTIFYMGINIGAFFGSILCGYIGETYGWAYGFGLAGFGMLFGLAVFVWGRPLLLGRGEPPRALARSTEWTMYGAGIGMVALCWAAIQFQSLVGYVLGGFGGALVIFVLFTAVVKLPSDERDRIFAAMFLILTSIIFWALFEQAGSSLNLYTDRHVDRTMLGFEIPASVFQSVNAGFIFLLAPAFAATWTYLGRRQMEPSTPFKFGLGIIQVGLGFLVLVWGAGSVGVGAATPVVLIFLIYLLHTTGELCLSPVGLSAMNRLAPSHMASLIMGTWFFASATGNFAAGLIAAATGAEGVGEEAGKSVVLDVYFAVGWVAVGAGLFVLVISPLVRRLMHLDTLRDDNVSDDLIGGSAVGEPQAAGLHPEVRKQ